MPITISTLCWRLLPCPIMNNCRLANRRKSLLSVCVYDKRNSGALACLVVFVWRIDFWEFYVTFDIFEQLMKRLCNCRINDKRPWKSVYIITIMIFELYKMCFHSRIFYVYVKLKKNDYLRKEYNGYILGIWHEDSRLLGSHFLWQIWYEQLTFGMFNL